MNESWQELKETIIEMRDNDGTCTQQEVCKFLANLMDVLEKQMSSSENPNKWIPVSERLPEENITVIGTTKIDDIYKTELYDDCGEKKWYANGNFDVPIIAWMPLPQPYKAEGRDSE